MGDDDFEGAEIKIREFRPEDIPLSCTWLVIGPPATGKCLARDTPVIMFDRTVRKVQNISNGDVLLGDDLTPRTVYGTTSGVDRMYKVHHHTTSYVVNSAHILTVCTHNGVVDLPVSDILKFRDIRQFKGVKVNLESGETSFMEILKITDEGPGEYFGFCIDGNRRFMLANSMDVFPHEGIVTHNTTFIENMAYYKKHMYPTAKVFIGSEDNYQKFCDIFGKMYVMNMWNEEEERRHIMRQKKCVLENRKGAIANHSINILDDVTDDPKIFKTPLIQGLFKIGSQHWEQLLFVGLQYAIDVPPSVRTSVSYVAIGRVPEENQRRSLYDNFGGICGSYDKFCDILDQLTGDFTFVIFKRRSQSNELEDNIFWYRTKKLPPWKFGCDEYKKWAKDRYNPNYKEVVDV